MNLTWLLNYIAAIFLFTKSVCGYFITVDAHAEECFFERVTAGTKMGLMFEVAEGGFLDIDVSVRLWNSITNFHEFWKCNIDTVHLLYSLMYICALLIFVVIRGSLARLMLSVV